MNYRDEGVGRLGWLLRLWDDQDVRVTLRATAEALPVHNVTLDITALIDGGWLDADVDPQIEAQNAIGWTLAHSAPPIVLTEGRFDVEVLAAAISVLRPHLDGYLRLTDFEMKPEGSAPALVRTTRALAAAGVANRVIVLFDNDTAGELAVGQLAETQPPQNFTILQLPDIATGKRYPTLHPAGHIEHMDVNGYAGAIELYLGADALTTADGSLEPVQWTGYEERVGRHQGQLTNKKAIHDRFRDKVSAATDDPANRAGQDWSDLAAVLDLILDTLSRPTR